MIKNSLSKEAALTHEYLTDTFNYCPDTGIFTYKVTKGSRAVAGNRAGTLNNIGYRLIKIKEYLYLEHRLAWFYCFKEWPTGVLDHINRVRDDNRLDNLREVTESDNLHNMSTPKRNSSGIKGVSMQSGRWCARIMINRKEVHLGRYDTKEEAAEAYNRYKEENNIL